MKRSTKQILALVLAAVLTLCGSYLMVAAVSAQVEAATTAIAALPDADSITDPASQAYTDGLDAAMDAIYALAECSEEELFAIADYQKPFDLLFLLWVLPADLDNAPAAIPQSQQEVLEQAEWMCDAAGVINALPDGYSLFNEYTSVNDLGEGLGTTLLGQLIDQYYNVGVRIEAYLSTLPQADQDALNAQLEEMFNAVDPNPTNEQRFADALSQFPDEFTVDNILPYAADFCSLNQQVDFGWYDLTDVAQADLDKYERLSEEFQVVIGIHRDAVIDNLEQWIDQVCDVDAVADYSPLKMQLFVEDECLALERAIYAIEDTLGCYAEYNIQNLDLFYEYYEAVFYSPYIPPYMVGDVDDDGEVTAADALEVLKAVVGKFYLTPSQELAADVDENGEQSAVDALYILQYVVGKQEFLPVYDDTVLASDYAL